MPVLSENASWVLAICPRAGRVLPGFRPAGNRMCSVETSRHGCACTQRGGEQWTQQLMRRCSDTGVAAARCARSLPGARAASRPATGDKSAKAGRWAKKDCHAASPCVPAGKGAGAGAAGADSQKQCFSLRLGVSQGASAALEQQQPQLLAGDADATAIGAPDDTAHTTTTSAIAAKRVKLCSVPCVIIS